MKPKEIIEKLNLQEGVFGKTPDSLHDLLAQELLDVCNRMQVTKSSGFEANRKFNSAIKDIRAKWTAISNKIPYGLKEGSWTYFLETRAEALREQFILQGVLKTPKRKKPSNNTRL